MIKVTIYQNDKRQFVGFDVWGHAGFNTDGADIVCAAVSVLVINTMNAIEKYVSKEISIDEDVSRELIEFRLKEEPTHDTQLLLNTMILGLGELEDDSDYEPYIDIIFEEV